MTFNLPLFLTACAATPTDVPTSGRPKRSDGLTDFPGEEPSEKELGDWLDENDPPLRTNFGALMRGETPTNLVQYEATTRRPAGHGHSGRQGTMITSFVIAPGRARHTPSGGTNRI